MHPRVPWPPPPAHQTDLYSRGCGVFSLYQTHGDPGLYSPGAKLPPAFIPSSKVTEPLYTYTGGGHLQGIPPHPSLQQLEVLAKNFSPHQRLGKADEHAHSGNYLGSPLRMPRSQDLAAASAVTVIDLSADAAKSSPFVKQELNSESFLEHRKDDRPYGTLKVLVPPGGDMSLPKGAKFGLPNMVSCGKLGFPSPGSLGKLSPGGRHITLTPTPGGCSRTTPLNYRSPDIIVKKEPLLSPYDTSASVFLSPPSDAEASNQVKIETDSDVGKNGHSGDILTMSDILGHSSCSQILDPARCLAPVLHHATNTNSLLGAVFAGGGVCGERQANHMASWPSPLAGHTLWQYPAPMEQYPPVGFQLIRDPMTGHYLLVPAASVEAVQRAILWPTFTGSSGQMMVPPGNTAHLVLESAVPPPPPPHLLLDTSVPSLPSLDGLTLESARQPHPPRRLLLTPDPPAVPNVTELPPTPPNIKVESSANCAEMNIVTDYKNSTDLTVSTVSSVASESVFYPCGIDSPARPLTNHTETAARIQTPIATAIESPSPPSPPVEPLKLEEPLPASATPAPDASPPSTPVDVTGLELLSNSIERHNMHVDHVEPPAPPATPASQPLGRLAVLCALAEQLRGSELDCEAPSLSRECDLEPSCPSGAELSPPILEKVTDIEFDDTSDCSRPPNLTPHSPVRVKKSFESDWLESISRKRKVGRPKKQFLATEMLLMKKTSSEADKLRKFRPKLKATLRENEGNETDRSEARAPVCVTIDSELLSTEKLPLRVLTERDGVYYAGQLSAIRAPDVYGITIDGERGNRPHIFSREQIIRDTIIEVKPRDMRELAPGARVCAYWSDQYRHLYPGVVTSNADDDSHSLAQESLLVSVSFDDGDDGRISLDDIRLLPPKIYVPDTEADTITNPAKRRRRTSRADTTLDVPAMLPYVKLEKLDCDSLELTSGEMSSVLIKHEVLSDQDDVKSQKQRQLSEEELDMIPVQDEKRQRKHLKKKRREKLKRLQSLSADGTLESSSHSEGRHRHRKHKKCSSPHHHRHHKKHRKHKRKHRDRLQSTESHSKMAPFLPAKQLWNWADKGHPRPGVKGRVKKTLHKSIKRGREIIQVGDCAVFLSTGRPDRPYIGRIESMWEGAKNNMDVRVKWFYHPEETVGCPANLHYPGALFESPHEDRNDVQTISHKCEVVSLAEYTERLGTEPWRYSAVYENNDMYYLAGYYNPTTTTLRMQPGVE